MLPQRQINFLLSLLVSLKCSRQLPALLIGFFEFIGLKSVNAFAHHREYITGVPPSFSNGGHLGVLFIGMRHFKRDL